MRRGGSTTKPWLALALSQCEHSPGWLDFLVFVDELSAQEEMS